MTTDDITLPESARRPAPRAAAVAWALRPLGLATAAAVVAAVLALWAWGKAADARAAASPRETSKVPGAPG